MCGIVGIVQESNTKIGKEIVDALTRLEYRGYDSVGIAAIENNRLRIIKDEGKISEVVEKVNFESMYGKIAIGHTRWATHGPPTKINAHPHTDCEKNISVIHNGIIENFSQLKEELIEQGHIFQSETDTEVLPHLIEQVLKEEETSLKEAIIRAIEKIEGTYAICIISTIEPDKIFCVKKDSPLVLGINDGRMFCASDIPAFLSQTREVVLLHDFEMVILTGKNYEIIDLETRKRINRKPYTVSWKPEMAQKAGFPHFMLKEIHEQPSSLADYIRVQQSSIAKIAGQISEAKKIFFLAAGTAYHSTLTGQYLVRKFAKKPSESIIASEYKTIIELVDKDTVIIPVSQSGETMDTLMAIKRMKERGAKVFSAVNVIGSSITHYSDEIIYLYAGPEIGVAATKTYTAQTLAMWDVGLELGRIEGEIGESEYKDYRKKFQKIPEIIKQTITRNEAKANNLASWLANKTSSFYLGRGVNVQSAKEGALKMKEIAYIHSEAYPAGESKHGPIALIEEDYPVIFVAPRDETHRLIKGNIMEMKARGAATIGILEEGDEELKSLTKWNFQVPEGYSEMFSTIAYIIPLQLLAYYTAMKKGCEIDKPRNLAKSVTVL